MRTTKTLNRMLMRSLAVALAFWLGTTLAATAEQRQKITLQVLDGRNGRPLRNQRVVVFTGISSEEAKSHAHHTAVSTDSAGLATFSIDPSETQWFQIFVDWRVVCFPNPNQSAFALNEIISTGVATPNTCSSVRKETKPGQFIVFARPATFIEKMKR